MTTFKFRSTQDWDEDRYPRIAGRISAFDAVDDDGRPAKFAVVDTPTGVFRVFETYQLKEAWAGAAVGDGIFLETLGTKQLKAGRKLRLFNVQLWEWNEKEGIPREIRAILERDAARPLPPRVDAYTPPAEG